MSFFIIITDLKKCMKIIKSCKNYMFVNKIYILDKFLNLVILILVNFQKMPKYAIIIFPPKKKPQLYDSIYAYIFWHFQKLVKRRICWFSTMPHGAIRFPFGKCHVCQDQATGVHYGVATCEGCKVNTRMCATFEI